MAELTEDVMSIAESSNWEEDLKQDFYVHWLTTDYKQEFETKDDLNRFLQSVYSKLKRNEERKVGNRRKLEQENREQIISNATPTLSKGIGGDPAEYVEGLDTLTRRWRTLSPLLRKIARRTFFGYTETPEKVAHDLGTTVAAVNMARTRIKQHMNGAK